MKLTSNIIAAIACLATATNAWTIDFYPASNTGDNPCYGTAKSLDGDGFSCVAAPSGYGFFIVVSGTGSFYYDDECIEQAGDDFPLGDCYGAADYIGITD